MQSSPPVISDAPPLLPPNASQKSGRRFLAIVLSLCLALFLADGLISFADDVLIVFFHTHILSVGRGIISILGLFMALGLYGLMGFTPLVPKRLFLPIPLFYLASALVMFPLAIFWYGGTEIIPLIISIVQLAVGLVILNFCRGRDAELRSTEGMEHSNALTTSVAPRAVPPKAGRRWFSWPLVPVEKLGVTGFSWKNLCVFALANAFVLLPFVAVYFFVCAAQAVHHYSEGFMSLHPTGFTVQARKYVRNDGKAIELFPMAHVANASFYQKVSQTFPTNSVVLLEGVTDSDNLLTNKLSYKRMAKSLGLAEQKETFAPSPSHGEAVRADIDVNQFSAETIDFLNLVTLFHSKGVTVENLVKMMQYSPQPGFEHRLLDDLLNKRNQHLLGEIRSRLPNSNDIVVPWGVAHMPGLAREIEASGFRVSETREYMVIRF